MTADLIFDSSFALWRMRRRWPANSEEESAQRQEALEVMLESFRKGEITSLDGVESANGRAMIERHGQRPFEMNSHWILSAQNWICPCCQRGKVDVSRLGSKGQILAKLVIHHDHMGEVIVEEFCRAFVGEGTDEPQVEGRRLVQRMGDAFAAYERVLICEDCNNADARAKRELGLPAYFSFSVGQIAKFIEPKAHVAHAVDLAIAQQVWEEAREAYELRMRLIRAVAKAAATDAHWYEPHNRGANPVPVFGWYGSGFGLPKIEEWLDLEALVKALGPSTKLHASNRAKWRTIRAKAGKPLPNNFLAMLRSAQHMAANWDELPEDWCCPVCQRSKRDQVYLGPKGQIQFRTPPTSRNRAWQGQYICNDCQRVVMSMKEEVTERAGHRPDSYGYFSPQELRAIVQARPHSPHLIKPKEAEALVQLAIERVALGAAHSVSE